MLGQIIEEQFPENILKAYISLTAFDQVEKHKPFPFQVPNFLFTSPDYRENALINISICFSFISCFITQKLSDRGFSPEIWKEWLTLDNK